MLATELNSHQSSVELLRTRYDFVIAEIAALHAQVESIEQFIAKHRETEASGFSREMAEALQVAAGKHALILDAIRENLNLGNEYKTISQEITTASAQNDQVEQHTQQIKNQSKNAQRMLSLSGISPRLVSILREQRHALFAATNPIKLSQILLNQNADASVRQFEIEQQLKILQDIGLAVENKFALNGIHANSEHEKMSVKVELQLLLGQQHNLLEKINQAYTEYLAILETLRVNTYELTETSSHYANYLDKNLLWVKNT